MCERVFVLGFYANHWLIAAAPRVGLGSCQDGTGSVVSARYSWQLRTLQAVLAPKRGLTAALLTQAGDVASGDSVPKAAIGASIFLNALSEKSIYH